MSATPLISALCLFNKYNKIAPSNSLRNKQKLIGDMLVCK